MDQALVKKTEVRTCAWDLTFPEFYSLPLSLHEGKQHLSLSSILLVLFHLSEDFVNKKQKLDSAVFYFHIFQYLVCSLQKKKIHISYYFSCFTLLILPLTYILPFEIYTLSLGSVHVIGPCLTLLSYFSFCVYRGNPFIQFTI